jgi:uncharacterized membrane protein
MKKKRIIKIGIVTLLTVFLATIILLNMKGVTFGELKIFELLELFVAVPLLVIVFYWLVAAKFDEFHERLTDMERHFEKIETKLGTEERTLATEIKQLKKIADKIDKDVRFLGRMKK